MERLHDHKTRRVLVGFVVVLVLGTIEFANGDTITVGTLEGSDVSTIQTGIDVAMDGDVVLVAPGEYVISDGQ